MSDLHCTMVGDGPIRYVFCHGLFGQGRNWTTVARQLRPAASLLVDLPNHGASPWTERFSYPAMAESLTELLREVSADPTVHDLTVVGHSMGGRVTMLAALAYPELVDRLVVVDVAPYPAPGQSVGTYGRALQSLSDEAMSSRRTAAAALAETVPDRRIRGFLLTGYRRGPGKPGWRFNLDMLTRDLDRIMTWPDPGPVLPYAGPVLWLAGGRSTYITPASYPVMARLFPHYRLETIAKAGHWVHADAPQAFLEALTRFVAETPLAAH